MEVALAVEEADADEGQPEVAGRLAVVAGQDAEAAGIDGQAFVEAELGAEVGDQIVFLELPGVETAHHRQVVVGVVVDNTRLKPQEDRVFRRGFEALLVGPLEEGLGVVAGGRHRRWRGWRKAPGGAVPAVPEVVGEFFQPLDARRNLGLTSSL